MLVICFRGGLGNQLFQYAFGRFIARKAGSEIGANGSFYSPGQIARGRSLEIMSFDIPIAQEFPGNWLAGEEISLDGKKLEIISEEQFETNNRVFDRVLFEGADCAITGFWQCNLEHLTDREFRSLLAREILPMPELLSERYFHYEKEFASYDNGVAVHVRRGDYLNNKHMFCILGREYYRPAFRKVADRVDRPKFFIFSDDIDAVEKEDLFDDDVIYVKGTSAIEEFQLLRNCGNIIAANSTFSWWAAYLNEDPDRIVIIPRRYHPDDADQIEYEDSLYPFSPNWFFV